MVKNDWYEAGEQIKKLVQDAVDSKDFAQLGNTISNIVNDTVNSLQSALKENLGPDAQAGDPGAQSAGGSTRGACEYTNRAAAEQIRRNIQERRRQQEQGTARKTAVRAKVKVPGEFTAKAMKWFGYGMAGIFGLSLGIVGIIAVTAGVPLLAPIALLALMTGVNLCIGYSGKNRLGIAQRFRKYEEVIGERKSCPVAELALAVGKNERFVCRDLRRMIGLGLFREGYLDRDRTALITDRETYQQYLAEQDEKRRKDASEEERKKAEDARERSAKAGLTPECRELIAEGRQYIRHVHECNEKIEDPDMSAKLDRLELVITRIFRETEKNPEVAGDLKKMMSYYLPTTRKLLDAYCEMSEQPIRGQNIKNTQKEIESALDTINSAFENLLDSFFEDRAWDISSDITVLNSMLAQEGLTGKNFEVKHGGKSNE